MKLVKILVFAGLFIALAEGINLLLDQLLPAFEPSSHIVKQMKRKDRRLDVRRHETVGDGPFKEVAESVPIGTFFVTEATQRFTLKIYYSDSHIRERIHGRVLYPNSFAFHAVYKTGNDPWQHRRLWSVAGVRYHGLGTVDATSIELQVQFSHPIRVEPDGSLPFSDEDLHRIYAPQTHTVRVRDGVPVFE
jgi:hypothetical protein